MLENTKSGDAFWDNLVSQVQPFPDKPMVFFNRDGDCIEVVLSDESYRAERLDNLVTVYVGRESGELVGALIKGVRAFIRRTLAHAPGFAIEVEDGQIKLEYLFTAQLWSQAKPPNGSVIHTYKKLRDLAERGGLRVALEPEGV